MNHKTKTLVMSIVIVVTGTALTGCGGMAKVIKNARNLDSQSSVQLGRAANAGWKYDHYNDRDND